MDKPFRCLLLGIIAIVVLSSCDNAGSRKLAEELKPEQSKYKLHLFYPDDATPDKELTEVQAFINSDPAIADHVTEMSGHAYSERLSKELKTWGIQTYPMYVLVNKDGMVFKSPYLSEMKADIKQALKLK